MRLPPLNAIRAFSVAARHLSFKSAAEELFVTPAAITYQIKTLEDFLEVPLFVRGNRSISLTQAGQDCFNDIEAGFALISQGIQKAQDDSQKNQLVVTAGPAFTIKWLVPRLLDFSERYPAIQASISASLHKVNLHKGEADIAIRFGSPEEDQTLHIEHFGTDSVVPMCHPDLVETLSHNPSSLLKQTFIYDDSLLFSQYSIGWREWFNFAGLESFEPPTGMHFNQADHALQAAIDGNGVVLGRRILATPDIMSGRLAVLFPELEMETKLGFSLVCLPEKLALEKIRCFREWIQSFQFEYAKPKQSHSNLQEPL